MLLRRAEDDDEVLLTSPAARFLPGNSFHSSTADTPPPARPRPRVRSDATISIARRDVSWTSLRDTRAGPLRPRNVVAALFAARAPPSNDGASAGPKGRTLESTDAAEAHFG